MKPHMEGNMVRKVICALDTGNLAEAESLVRRLSPYVGAFKIGHALTLPHGLDVIDRLQDAGATRIFLDLKFHDIPNSVALAVREAAKHRVWMTTIHVAGGPAMIQAAADEANAYGEENAPLLMGVCVLTSLDQNVLTEFLGVNRTIQDHLVKLGKSALDAGIDGLISSPQEVKALRMNIGHRGIIVAPGIRPEGSSSHDQIRVGTASQAFDDGADYVVIGRALTDTPDVEAALVNLGFNLAAAG